MEPNKLDRRNKSLDIKQNPNFKIRFNNDDQSQYSIGDSLKEAKEIKLSIGKQRSKVMVQDQIDRWATEKSQTVSCC